MENAELRMVNEWWQTLQEDFKRLNQNYQDYMRELNSVKAEEMMKTKSIFCCLKDRLIEYLRSFCKESSIKCNEYRTITFQKLPKRSDSNDLRTTDGIRIIYSKD